MNHAVGRLLRQIPQQGNPCAAYYLPLRRICPVYLAVGDAGLYNRLLSKRVSWAHYAAGGILQWANGRAAIT